MISAIINTDSTIAAVIVADPTDPVPSGYENGAILVAAPQGCNEKWTYDPIAGFTEPNAIEDNKVDF